ncbi:probable LRR receptor-like serine/threonine-protein kinase At1g53430 [Lactuca sativa]|uniref:probable LRR receptor-like serine/threonine-protein kinase At1g53430 n=1 Tax=Lactuca sativa TaxID=4236 RepID=UPI000CB6FB84|nr:probable LRR receptor-like serine/threonine-protein kinase At1g53430 [Lactuca sativa]
MMDSSLRRPATATAGLKFLTVTLFLLPFLYDFRSDAQLLPAEEVEALQSIASSLQYNNWRVSSDSCSGGGGLNNTNSDNGQGLMRFGSNVTCSCNSTVCHITRIQLKGLNLTGVLPEEFANLTFLQEIDLSRNYINGTIPARFGQLRITILSLLGNRISGPIPREIGDISTLEELVLEDNLLSGQLPPSLGRLTRLRRILLSANNFTGTIPESYGNLTNLEDFRIDGSTLSGRIPSLIGNWTRLIRLDWQGTSMEGPIPSTISLLTNLQELRITDLTGPSTTFPNLQNLTRMVRLHLRNCLLTGSIPEYIVQMSGMKNLDLSFNRLTGIVPDSIGRLSFDSVFFNNNSLSGDIPGWAFAFNNRKIDLSYNNFTQSQQRNCQPSSLNLVSALSPTEASNSNSWCMTDGLTCSRNPNRYELYINCGGTSLEFEGKEYEQDLTDERSYFNPAGERWAYSSNGVFMGNDNAPFVTRTNNVAGGDVYRSARLSPTSLRYYGLCLRTGSYKVRLHFAEIMYSDDMTFSSLGRRIFDVSIQGDLKLKDFNIMEAANGTGRGIYRDFDNIIVNNGSTIEIHLYWAGKGTTAIPDRGVYGPLISAITITPNFKVSTGGLSAGAIAGIVIGCCAFVLLILAVLWKLGYLGGDKEDKELRALELQTGYYSLRQIKAATHNFDSANKIGEGGFGPVYKGVLTDGSTIAVKQLSSKSKQGNREFVTEIGMISALQHPNLVKLYGCCIEGNQLLLIYEYLENNSLARALFGKEDQRLNLDWKTRQKICTQVAKGLAYLHEESRLKIVHRDIKATNVLLDKDLNAKISDFGLAKLDEGENTHISTRIAGTIGYMAPEYAMRGYLTDKADVYSFGIVALEIVSGKSNTNYRPKEEFVYLLDWAYVLQEQGNLLELVDPILGSHYSKKEAMRMLDVALLCTNPSPSLRPAMSAVVNMLDGKIPVQPSVVKRNGMDDAMRFRAFEIISQDSQTQTRSSIVSPESQLPRSTTIDDPWVDSSV